MAEYVDEFRGTDDLYYAEVTADNNDTTGTEGTIGYVTGTVKRLAPVAEISRTTETASDTKYYDNKPAFTINAEGADTITLNIPALDLATLADITGKQIDETTGAFMDGESTPKYFALGYRLGLTDGTYRYVWRYKGSFGIPDEASATKNAGTDSSGQTLTYTGIMTNHKFTKALDANGNPMAQKALVVDERDGKADVSDFFDQVTTCDTLEAATPASQTPATGGNG
jgi:phi13 family phage major tail protein